MGGKQNSHAGACLVSFLSFLSFFVCLAYSYSSYFKHCEKLYYSPGCSCQ